MTYGAIRSKYSFLFLFKQIRGFLLFLCRKGKKHSIKNIGFDCSKNKLRTSGRDSGVLPYFIQLINMLSPLK